jgi:hypothetical protein
MQTNHAPRQPRRGRKGREVHGLLLVGVGVVLGGGTPARDSRNGVYAPLGLGVGRYVAAHPRKPGIEPIG